MLHQGIKAVIRLAIVGKDTIMLFDEGDYERDYRYLNVSIGNANSYGAWLLNIRASTLQPIILPCTM